MRRVLIRIVLLLVIGAVINVASAWGLAIRPSPEGLLGSSSKPRWTAHVHEQQHAVNGSYDALVATRVFSRAAGEIEIIESAAPIRPFWETAVSNPEFENLVPAWSQLRERSPSLDRDETAWFVEWATGWPFLSLRAESWLTQISLSTDEMRVEDKGAIALPDAWRRTQRKIEINDLRCLRERNSVPFIPIWPGFYINTLLYACVAWLVFFAPFAALRVMKRARRRRKQLCLQCGYDLRGAASVGNATCPECGGAVVTA